jgi:hypothetical protein
MKKIILSLTLAALMAVSVSCKKKEDPAPETSSYTELSGSLSTQTLDASKKYLLKGTVFVDNGAVLTVPAGTVVYGDRVSKGTLVVKPGGKLNSNGTVSNPVIWTSKSPAGERDRGDWGGIILLGNANVNQNGPSIEGISPSVTYGTYNSTANNTESSGSITYTRIEYAGIALSPNNETNGLTFGGVGSGTVIDHVQVSYGGDDSFEWFGGVVECKNLICYAGWDDDIDMDFGFSGHIQFALVIRDPSGADQSGSNSFEVDNDASGSTNSPKTSPVVSNVTVYGARQDSAGNISANFQNGAHIRRNSAPSIFNSIITGNNVGILLDGDLTYANYIGGTGVLDKNIIAMAKKGTSAPAFYAVANNTTYVVGDVTTYWTSTKANTVATISTNPSKVADWSATGLSESLFFAENLSGYPVNPNFTVASGSLASGASFADAKFTGLTFFTSTTYRGAFDSATDWTDTWTDFNPQSTSH